MGRFPPLFRTHAPRSALARCLLILCALCAVSAVFAAEDPANDPALAAARKAEGAAKAGAYRELARKYPDSNVVRFEFGEALYATGEFEPALEAFRKAEALGQAAGPSALMAGKCLKKLHRNKEAEDEYRRALKADPSSVAAEYGIGEALFGQGRAKEAAEIFRKLAARTDDWAPYAKEYLAYCCTELGDHAQAEALLKEQAQARPKETYLAYEWAKALLKLERYADVLRVMPPLVKAEPEDEGRRYLLAMAQYKTKAYAEALPNFERVAAQKGAYANAAHYYRGLCLESTGRGREADAAYAEVDAKEKVWFDAAKERRDAIKGKPYRVFLDFLSGYDTGVVQGGDEAVATNAKDAFTQVFANVEGRVLRNPGVEIWLGAQHFGLQYPEVHDNDYFEDSALLRFELPGVGPFRKVNVEYALKYAQLDYQPYLREHKVTAEADYRNGPNRVKFGLYYAERDFFRDSEGLTGPAASFFFDYRRQLPLWDHELRLRANADYRWSHAEASERFTQRVRLMYRARMTGKLFGQLETGYRRDDYPESQKVSDAVALRHRTDHQLFGEVRMEYELWRHFSLNWGYRYESVDSRRASQEYGRHQIDAGFTFNF